MSLKKGDTIFFENCPSITGFATVGGKKESEGPLAEEFDCICVDTRMGEECWEKAESAYQRSAVEKALNKAGITLGDIDYLFAGDLQNQCTASAYTVRDLDVQFAGLYGACSTMAESLSLASSFVGSGICNRAMALTSSHFCAAERTFRTPLEYGGQRTPTAQWTVTAAGAVVVSAQGGAPYVKSVTLGHIRDFGIIDINNMGAAMAPAAAETILRYFADSGKKPIDFDHIYTGDLGLVGSTLLQEILKQEGVTLPNYSDCGMLIYDRLRQDVGAGGSGCGCSAAVLCAHILPEVQSGVMKNVLFVATGALMSPVTFMQGESIPGIAHLVHISSQK
ncbi:MAG: stage V sporulation protein AD [Oscillospiraceae bacterium]|nr:stage V sporulation protein AD [Oscillospiraceae bacterium]